MSDQKLFLVILPKTGQRTVLESLDVVERDLRGFGFVSGSKKADAVKSFGERAKVGEALVIGDGTIVGLLGREGLFCVPGEPPVVPGTRSS